MTDALPRRASRWLPAILVGLIMISALPLIQLPPWPAEFGQTTALRIVGEELAGRWLGTTSTSDFVPATVDRVPGPEGSLLEDFMAERPLDRVNRNTLPDSATVISEEITPLHFRYEVESDSDFLLRLFLFEFPGWEVVIDGEASERELGRPEGFIVVPVAAGKHVVEVKFGDTADRRFSYAVSGISIALAIGYGMLLKRNRDLLTVSEYEVPVNQQGGSVELTVVAVIAIVVTAANGALVETQGWLRHVSPSLMAIPAEFDQYADLDGKVALIGYDAPLVAKAGDELSLTIYWQALRPLTNNYQAFVHLLDADGRLLAQSDALNPGDFPTENWPTDKYVQDVHTVAVPAELDPGTYRWSVGLWLAGDGSRLQVLDSTGQSVGDTVILDQTLNVE